MKEILSKKKAAILDRWFQLIIASYPADTSRFLEKESDRFANPVGHTISQEIEIIFDELVGDMQSDRLATSLDNIIKVRSIQDFTPSQAIAFIFQVKKAIRDELGDEIKKDRLSDELIELESRIDKLVMAAADIYMGCREKIYEIRVNEAKKEVEQMSILLERTNSLYANLDKQLDGSTGE